MSTIVKQFNWRLANYWAARKRTFVNYKVRKRGLTTLKMIQPINISDESLVRLYQDAQSPVYFELLYRRYRTKIYKKCLFFMKDSDLAQDMTHDIFLKLTQKLLSYRQKSAFTAWINSVAHNYCLDYVRLEAYRRKVFLTYDTQVIHRPVSGEDDHNDQLDRQLNYFYQELSLEEQSMMRMKYQDNISIRELARFSGVTESALKMRLKRCRDKLRNSYSLHLARIA